MTFFEMNLGLIEIEDNNRGFLKQLECMIFSNVTLLVQNNPLFAFQA